jgi:hypothetical protein
MLSSRAEPVVEKEGAVGDRSPFPFHSFVNVLSAALAC